MRAIVITTPGAPDVLEERDRPVPEPGPREIRVHVHATALNRADLLQRRGRYPAPPGVPADVPGLEFAGEVDAVGRHVQRWVEGERVMGLVGGGGYSEAVVVHEREAVAVPDTLSLEEAAAVPEAFVTAHDALFTRLGLAMGERLLIHAVGSGVGLAALQLAKAAGATTIGTSRTPEKLRRAVDAFGLDVAIDTADDEFADAVRDAAGGEGVHAILDLVGGGYLAANIDSLATLGRMVVVGLVSGRSAEIDLGAVLRKRLTIVGTALRSRPLEQKIAAIRTFERHALPLLADGRIRPVIDRIVPFDDVREAHRAMEANENFGKIVLSWEA
ncbi:MAG: NAD(P)H-quinone oxidoreductase [Gemmatimonadota bacterium]